MYNSQIRISYIDSDPLTPTLDEEEGKRSKTAGRIKEGNTSVSASPPQKKMGYYSKSVYKKVKPLRDTMMADIKALL